MDEVAYKHNAIMLVRININQSLFVYFTLTEGYQLQFKAKLATNVYKVDKIDEDADPNKDLADSTFALKVSPTSLLWEFYISQQISKRVSPTMVCQACLK